MFRFKCDECLIVFDLCPVPPSEWIEPMPDDADVGEMMHDVPIKSDR